MTILTFPRPTPCAPRERRSVPRDDLPSMAELLAEDMARKRRDALEHMAKVSGETRREACRQHRQNICRKALWRMRQADHRDGRVIPIQLLRVPK